MPPAGRVCAGRGHGCSSAAVKTLGVESRTPPPGLAFRGGKRPRVLPLSQLRSDRRLHQRPPHFTLRGGGRPQSLRPAPGALALWGKVARVTATCQELTKVCPMRGRQTGRHED